MIDPQEPFTQSEIRAAVGLALASRDAALNQAITLAIECERLRARIIELESLLASKQQQQEPSQ